MFILLLMTAVKSDGFKLEKSMYSYIYNEKKEQREVDTSKKRLLKWIRKWNAKRQQKSNTNSAMPGTSTKISLKSP